MRVLLFGCSADDAQHTLKFGDRMEIAYLPSYDFKEIRDEIERFNPQLVTCSTSVFLLGLGFQPSDVAAPNGEHTSATPELSSIPHVAPREMKVLTMLARGRTNNEIAVTLRVSTRTVKRILSSLFERFAAANRTELASRAAKLRLPQNDN
ncbi:DNA-binding CsgD family transcriptional regulator [Silvibacterium bohemicum]|uniref:DNA-binding CsgD family transcriptional regulator n=2 Tax=Silvibacterium bohemicum TaxID=1577686 RepID=A0A841JNR8_9BACT|nr:helix-turn-helix transcriptional regulator [Silvibacterium bohemicum]MBB6143006.1 DNA-binding CsgD family transcriptional regulator [Silvibacterium bohemicum]